jgi:putative CocE/NonD family hydrolase
MKDSGTDAVQRVMMERDVPARMRDGVVLRANVYRPGGDGPWPTLLLRTPYDKRITGKAGKASTELDPVETAARGFMVVIQDTRGRYASEGDWMPLTYEREDGYDSVEWAAKLPGSSGRVGMIGQSYMGNTPWAAAIEKAPSLAAIVPEVTASDFLNGGWARGGAIELAITAWWTLMMGAAHLERLGLSEQERGERLTALLDDTDRLSSDGFWGLPVHDLPVLRKHGFPEFGALRRLEDLDIVTRCRVAGEHEHVTVPSFNVGGWYDIVAQGTLDNYMGMAALGRPTRLLMGPWTHVLYEDPIGELCYGTRGGGVGVPAHAHGDLNDERLAWLRRYLVADGTPREVEEPPVRIFVMGRNVWRDEASWPLARARNERWFLSEGEDLGRQAPDADAGSTEFVYDPSDPVPTHGGQTLLLRNFPVDGPLDQARIESRPDVCVFTSEVLQQDLEVTGRVRVVLHAESSAPSTDWVARLCDVHPEGSSFNICDGILRVEKGADRLQEIEIDLWSTSNVFLAGHRLRVHVTSSSFPRWDRNLNTGNQRETRMQTAQQRIHHNSGHASFIELPVVES